MICWNLDAGLVGRRRTAKSFTEGSTVERTTPLWATEGIASGMGKTDWENEHTER